MVPISVGFAALGFAMVAAGEWMGILVGLIGVLYLTVLAVACLSRRDALVVAENGITLGLLPPWSATGHAAFVPWSDVEAIVLWRQPAGFASVRYIGVERRTGAPPLPGSARNPILRRMNKAVVPTHVSEALVADSRMVGYWRLDKERLTSAVHHFAPHVQVVDEI